MLNVILALATGALLILTFPAADFSFLAPVALAPLLVAASREARWWRRVLLGYAAGFVYWFGACYWIQFVLEVHGNMGRWGSWGCFLLFCLFKALQMAVFALAAGAVMRRVYAVPAVAALWVAIERTHASMGFAWQALGNAGISMSVPLRLAPFTGMYGLSFVFVMMNAAVALVALRRRRREIAWLLALPLLYLLPSMPDAARGTESAVLVQPNISESMDWDSRAVERSYTRLTYLSLKAALSDATSTPGLLVWPEVPAPFVYDTDPAFRQQMDTLARLAHTYFLFGVVAHAPDGAPLNSAVLVGPGGEYLGRYDKMNLVPFGEYVPSFFGFVNRITQEAGDFKPGANLVVFRAGDDHKVGAFICYEAALPHFVRRFAAGGAQVLVNMSNDGYFGHSAAREQHLKIVRMRAVENRRWILRSTNDGLTAAIDPAGRLLTRVPPYVEVAQRTNYSYVNEQTPYTRYGDWFPLLCTIAGLIALVVATRAESPARRRP